MARRTAGKLAYEAGIERGTPDVSIAREMDTPFHRVLLSGLVYARARLTVGPCLNRRSGSQPASQPVRTASPHLVWVFYVILLTPSFALCCSPRSSDERNVRMPRDVTRARVPRMESDLFDAGFYRVPRRADEIHYCILGVSDFYVQWAAHDINYF